MKVSVAALSFLIVLLFIGSQGRVIQELRESTLMHRPHLPRFHLDSHQPSNCCTSYTLRKIRCAIMKDYFETSSGCSKPGVIFITRKGKHVCANPRDKRVQDCMRTLRPVN